MIQGGSLDIQCYEQRLNITKFPNRDSEKEIWFIYNVFFFYFFSDIAVKIGE